MVDNKKKFDPEQKILTSGTDLDNNILNVNDFSDMFKQVDSGTIARGSLAPLIAVLLLKKRATINSLAQYIKSNR